MRSTIPGAGREFQYIHTTDDFNLLDEDIPNPIQPRTAPSANWSSNPVCVEPFVVMHDESSTWTFEEFGRIYTQASVARIVLFYTYTCWACSIEYPVVAGS
jgi:hypothetical protein